MTDRLKGVWVAFEHDIRVDDAEPIINAIKQIRGVIAVEGTVSNSDDWMNRKMIQLEFRKAIWDALETKKP